MKKRLIALAVFALGSMASATAGATINFGFLSFDQLIPADSSSVGVNAFNIYNFTGAFNSPPGFPVVDPVIFQNATLTLFGAGTSVISLGNIGPGVLLDASFNPVVQVPGDQLFTSARFDATLVPQTVQLSDGSFFTANSTAITALFSHSGGGTLAAGADFGFISADGQIGPPTVPEPGSWILLLTVACVLGYIFQKRRTGVRVRK